MNGSVGMVKSIIYKSPNGPADKNALAKYVIVDFKQSTLSANEPMMEGAPSIWISEPVVKIGMRNISAQSLQFHFKSAYP